MLIAVSFMQIDPPVRGAEKNYFAACCCVQDAANSSHLPATPFAGY